MGKKFIDFYSLLHFLAGFFSFIFLKKLNFNDYYNFFITNGLHLLLEIIEHNKDPNGKILEIGPSLNMDADKVIDAENK